MSRGYRTIGLGHHGSPVVGASLSRFACDGTPLYGLPYSREIEVSYINLNSPSRACQFNCTSAPHLRVVRFKIVVRHVTLRSQNPTHHIRVPILPSLLTSQFSQPPLPQRQLHPVPPPVQPSRQSRRQLPPWQRFGKLRRGFLQLHFLSCSGYRRRSHLFRN